MKIVIAINVLNRYFNETFKFSKSLLKQMLVKFSFKIVQLLNLQTK